MPYLYNREEYIKRRRELRQQSSKAERILWERLRARRFYGLKFRRQFSIGVYVADFYCPELRLVVEVDGEQHLFQPQIEHDRRRTTWLNNLGIQVIRFSCDEVQLATDDVLERLKVFITSLTPSSREEGR